MKIDSHSGVVRYPALVPAFAGMTTGISDRGRNNMRHFHASLCPFQGVTVSGENSNSENASPPIERETRAISIVVAILTSMVSGVNIYVPKSR